MENRAAVGLGPWLLQKRGSANRLSLDATAQLLEHQSFAAWQAEQLEEEEAARIFARVFDEAWESELTPQEQAVLRGIYWDGKSEAAVARALGLHHSTVKRCRERAQGKLERGLRYVLRYRELAARS
ncbi:MAG: LuxR C-terminal-related transcriptional regulator [Oscillospiraceae bacterium]|jgi:RNA polymerase sigma factor (sigma-70 family)|nr:LuxR C-terminal-related transcriptional regulator [Oscillospiraceae bacterium]